MTTIVHRATVFAEPGRFAGWPANYGMWAWGDEVLVGFVVGQVGTLDGVHARDASRPFVPMLARSHDRGSTWRAEPFTGRTPGTESLSADEHVGAGLAAGPRLRDTDFAPIAEPVRFDDPETIVMCARTGLAAGARSWFYVSVDRGRRWTGPHPLPSFGLSGIAARTDVVGLSTHAALFLLTAAKTDGDEGRVFAARTQDGGRTFALAGWLNDAPAGWEIMPSSIRRGDSIWTAVRCADPRGPGRRNWIDLYRSDDAGTSWRRVATPVADTGYAGNPPAMTALPNDRLAIVYGARHEPFGLRWVTSSGGDWQAWAEPRVLTDDTACHDLGYPRVASLPDGSLLACYYSNSAPDSERTIEAVRWRP